jgi:DNA-binding NtrC family response regulator
VRAPACGAKASARGQERAAAPHVLEDAGTRALYAQAERVAAGPIKVLVTGETGSGKELLAAAV